MQWKFTNTEHKQSGRTSTSDKPFVEVWLQHRYNVSEAQLKVLASQRVLSVVLDQRLQAGKVEVGREIEVRNPALGTSANEAVLDPPTAPERQKGANIGMLDEP